MSGPQQPPGRMNVRPKGSDGLLYCPQRDLAYIYAPAMKEAIKALDKDEWTDTVKLLVTRLHLTEREISVAVGCLVEAHKMFVNVPKVSSAQDALLRSGWYECNPGARYLVYGRLGEVMLGGFFLALRDVSPIADESAQQHQIADFVAAGVGVAGRLVGEHGDKPAGYDYAHEAETARQELHLLRAAFEEHKKFAEEAYKHAVDRDHERIMRTDANFKAVGDALDAYNTSGYWSRLWRALMGHKIHIDWPSNEETS